MNWDMVKLGELCEVLDTLRKPITKKFRKAGKYPYYGATGIVDWVDDYIFEEELVLVGEDGAKWDAGEKTAFIVDGKYWVNNHAHVVKPNKDKLLKKWLTYYLCGIDLKPWVTGLTVPKLNQAQLKSIPIPLPSIPEQQRIVAKIDSAFAKIDEVNKLNNIHFNNLEILAKSTINNILNNTSYGWNTKFLYQISDNFDSKRIPITKNKRKKGDIPYYGASGIVDYVENYIFDDDLLLVSEDGANLLMRTYPIAFSASGKSWVNNHAHVLKFNNLNLQKWVETYLNYIDLSSYISGMAQPKLNQKKLNEIPIIIPSETKLKKVISIINEIHNKIKELTEINRRKLNLLKILNNSILLKELQSKKAA